MPYVNVQTAGNLTREQREQIAREISDTLHRVAGKPPSVTYVTFQEIPLDHWAVGGQLLDQK